MEKKKITDTIDIWIPFETEAEKKERKKDIREKKKLMKD